MNLETGVYGGFLQQYGGPSEDFLQRDARENFGFDGTNLLTARNGKQTYRNGDIRVHGIVWLASDAIFDYLNRFPDFQKPPVTNFPEYQRYVRFQFSFLSSIYEKWCRRPTIGKPIDCFSFHQP